MTWEGDIGALRSSADRLAAIVAANEPLDRDGYWFEHNRRGLGSAVTQRRIVKLLLELDRLWTSWTTPGEPLPALVHLNLPPWERKASGALLSDIDHWRARADMVHDQLKDLRPTLTPRGLLDLLCASADRLSAGIVAETPMPRGEFTAELNLLDEEVLEERLFGTERIPDGVTLHDRLVRALWSQGHHLSRLWTSLGVQLGYMQDFTNFYDHYPAQRAIDEESRRHTDVRQMMLNSVDAWRGQLNDVLARYGDADPSLRQRE